VHLGARDDPRRPGLVPHPDVLHHQARERIRRLVVSLDLQPVAQVGRLGGQHAVAKQAEYRRVFTLQPQLELGVVLLEVVDVGHRRKVYAIALDVPLRGGIGRLEGGAGYGQVAYALEVGESGQVMAGSQRP
jgi:hypothetical protein